MIAFGESVLIIVVVLEDGQRGICGQDVCDFRPHRGDRGFGFVPAASKLGPGNELLLCIYAHRHSGALGCSLDGTPAHIWNILPWQCRGLCGVVSDGVDAGIGPILAQRCGASGRR